MIMHRPIYNAESDQDEPLNAHILTVSPKNMTRGLNSPWLVGKATLCSSLFLDAHVIVPPSDVKLGEYVSMLKLVEHFWDQGQWIAVLDGHGIQLPVVL